MFDHSDADDLIERPIIREIPIVAHLDPTAMRQPPFPDALPCQVCLTVAEGNAEGFDTVSLRRVQDQTSPPAPDVEQPFSRPEP
jgi:hypothetical protein